jgi:hypothetical protein
MTIYSGKNYRKIWESHFGQIPKDSDGKSYEIHHIDGNRSNNNIKNLKCVSIQEHYNIHHAQSDWAECLFISERMKISPEDQSRLATLSNKKRIYEGTHHFLGNDLQRRRIEERTHNFVGENNPSKRRVKEGTHQFLDSNFQKEMNRRRIAEGRHHLLGEENNRKMLSSGKHASQKKLKCPHCEKITSSNNAKRWHFDKCRILN